MLLNRTIFSIVTIAAVLNLGGAAYAQSRPPAPDTQAQRPSTPQSAVEDKDIQAFANATSDVQLVQRKWMPTIVSQPSPVAQRKAQEQALDEMARAVEKNGLSVTKYNQIAELAQADPEVHRKIESRLQQSGKSLEPQGDEMDNDKEE